MRRFYLERIEDPTGVSGTGVVAHGVEFGDGSCVLRWLTQFRSTVFYDSLEHIRHIHGHGGLTRVVLLDDVVVDARGDIAYLKVRGGPVERTVADAMVNVDFDKAGRVVGVEFEVWPPRDGAAVAAALREVVPGLREAVENLQTDLAQDALEDPVGNFEREKAGFYRVAKSAVDGLVAAVLGKKGAPDGGGGGA